MATVLERDRFRVRAKELQRQKLVLDNELQSPGISEAEREYIQQRIQTLSIEEDGLALNLARVERQLDAQRHAEQEQQASVRSTPSRSPGIRTVAPDQRAEVVRTVQNSLSKNLVATEQQFTRSHTTDQRNVDSLKRNMRPPRKLIYFPLIYLCIVVDVLALLNLTGIAIPFIEAIDIAFSIFTFVVSIFLGRSMKRVRVSGERVSQVITRVEQRAALYRQRVAIVLRYARRTQAGRSILRSRTGRKVVALTAKLSKATRLPVLRSIGAGVLEIIPMVNTLPWYTINMIVTYREHLKEYRASLATADDYPLAAVEESEAVQEFQEAQVAQAEGVLQAITS